MVLWQGQSKATVTTDTPISFSWNIWQALVSLGKFEIKYFHSLNALPFRSTSHRIQTSTNVVIHSFSRRGSCILTTATLSWYSVSACTQTRISGRDMEMLPGCKYANLQTKLLWVVCGHYSKLYHHHTVDRIACTTECDGPPYVRMLLGLCRNKLCIDYKSNEIYTVGQPAKLVTVTSK